MNVTVAIDSFKGSLSSAASGRAICEGIRRVYPDAMVTVCPIADGGEGTVDALTQGIGLCFCNLFRRSASKRH